ncbi:PhoPQ-activated pathogenicity-related family protein [Echinicola sediminis]
MNMYPNPLKLLAVMIAAFFFSSAHGQQSSLALENYLKSSDSDYQVELVEKVQGNALTQYELMLTSQKWKGLTWKHRLVLLAPEHIEFEQAMLYIGGGTLKNGEPQRRDRDNQVIKNLERLAIENRALVAAVFQIPNQPIFDGKVEDEIISYTLHQYQETGDETWPLLFPMVKSAQKAMDAVVDFAQEHLNTPIQHFLLTGLSKRGWTTWLTGSQDPRVNAIAPMVIDVLNMPVSLQYQIAMWQDYSPEIQDYVDLGIPQQSNTPAGKATITMVDPFSYREQLSMPKMVFIGTNDPYWPIDAAKNYWNQLSGDNELVYIPNVAHGLGDGQIALQNLSAFFEYQCLQKSLPDIGMEINERHQGKLEIKPTSSGQSPDYIELWIASSKEDKDFRDEKWRSFPIKDLSYEVKLPQRGQKALYLAFHFTSPQGKSYYISSRMLRIDAQGIVP